MLSLLGITAGLVLLIGGGTLLVRGASAIASSLGISPMVVGLTIVGFGTSMPELVVNIIGALEGATGLAFGNVVGSNISNLGLVLNDLQNRPDTKRQILERLRTFYDAVTDVTTKIQGGTVQIFFHEKDLKHPVPATRLSDGTLRYLCLLAILCHPEPPPWRSSSSSSLEPAASSRLTMSRNV